MRNMNLSLLLALNFLSAHQGFGMGLDLPGGEPPAAVAPAHIPIPRKALSPSEQKNHAIDWSIMAIKRAMQALPKSVNETYASERTRFYMESMDTLEEIFKDPHKRSTLLSSHQNALKMMSVLLNFHGQTQGSKHLRQNILFALNIEQFFEEKRVVNSLSTPKEKERERIWNFHLGSSILKLLERDESVEKIGLERCLFLQRQAILLFDKAHFNHNVHATRTPLLLKSQVLSLESLLGDDDERARKLEQAKASMDEFFASKSPDKKADSQKDAVSLSGAHDEFAIPEARTDIIQKRAHIVYASIVALQRTTHVSLDSEVEEVDEVAPAGPGVGGSGAPVVVAPVKSPKKRGLTRVIESDDERSDGEEGGAGGSAGGGVSSHQTPRKPGGVAPGLMVDTDLGGPSVDAMDSGGSGGGSSARKLRTPEQYRKHLERQRQGIKVRDVSKKERELHILELSKLKSQTGEISKYCKTHGLAYKYWFSALEADLEKSQGMVSMDKFKGDKAGLFEKIKSGENSIAHFARINKITTGSLRKAYQKWNTAHSPSASASAGAHDDEDEGSASSDSD